jgi:DnaJ-class molecular chaperone
MQVEAPQVEADLSDIARRLASIPRAHNAIWQELLKLKGHGAPKLKGSGKGDLLVRVRLTVPKKLTKKQRELVEELKRTGA